MKDMLTNIFVQCDDFCKLNFEEIKKKLKEKYKKNLDIKHKMTISEVLTIVIYFPLSKIKTFKDYFCFIEKYHRSEFKNLCSYKNMIEYKNKINFVIEDFLNEITSKKSSIEGYIDSTTIETCHNKRRKTYKTLRSISGNGKGTMGFFTGVKFNLIIDFYSNMLGFSIMSGNKADNNIDELIKILKKTNVKNVYGDKGFMLSAINKDKIHNIGKTITTRTRNNMKKSILTKQEDSNLKKRTLIESVYNILKNTLGLSHTRHRSINGFFTHIYSVLAAYCFHREHPSAALFFA